MENDKLSVWLKSVIAGLVSNPDEIVITKTTDDQGILFTIQVAKDDAGKIIGKAGVIANAIRTLLRASGMSIENARASMKIDAPNKY